MMNVAALIKTMKKANKIVTKIAPVPNHKAKFQAQASHTNLDPKFPKTSDISNHIQ